MKGVSKILSIDFVVFVSASINVDVCIGICVDFYVVSAGVGVDMCIDFVLWT